MIAVGNALRGVPLRPEWIRLASRLVPRELRRENAELRQQVKELRCDVGYWKGMHARAVERNSKLQVELDQSKAEIRQLKAERFGKQSEKQSATDRSNDLDDPQQQATPKKKRGQQPGRPLCANPPLRRIFTKQQALCIFSKFVVLVQSRNVTACFISINSPCQEIAHEAIIPIDYETLRISCRVRLHVDRLSLRSFRERRGQWTAWIDKDLSA